jgi:hypothetical protein
MATVKARIGLVAAVGLVLWGCSKPIGLDIPVQPLKQIRVLVTLAGDSNAGGTVDAGGTASVDADTTVDADGVDTGTSVDADLVDGGAWVDAGGGPFVLHAALVWGMQWLPEPFCVLQAAQPESAAAAAVVAAGCRDSLGFVPNRAGADTVITPGVPATLDLFTLPAADVMVGDITARIAYASVIIYEDRNGNGVLDFRHPQRQRRRGEPIDDAGGAPDVVYGASFISMTQPDQRVAFLEGDFNSLRDVAFYPRKGCLPDPPKGFSILSAGGFSKAAALASFFTGQLPSETDPTACATATLDDTMVIPIATKAPAVLSQLACTSNDEGGVTYYRVAPSDPPVDLQHATWACASVPRLGTGGAAPDKQVVVALRASPGNACQTTLHYTLRGCDNDPFCATPSWDLIATANVPSWWHDACPDWP